jgi:glycosyltransferase involved in cell wall biosynthesis
LATQGETQLLALKDKTDLALADSGYNERQLREAGYTETGVLPIALAKNAYQHPDNDKIVSHFADKRPLLLFVGRFAPNKKQEDLVKLLYYLRRSQPDAHLALVGDRWIVDYDTFVASLAADLGVEEGLTITGKVSQPDLVTYYRTADFYVSMSEHEGFGKPIIESMHLGLPVLAYGAEGVLDTMGPTGVRFHAKKYAHLAELINLLLDDQALRQRLAKRQEEHVQQFYEPHVAATFRAYLEQLLNDA